MGSYQRDFSKFRGLVLIVWTGLLALSATFYLWQTRNEVLERAMSDAISTVTGDVGYRRWITKQRGVYVLVSELTRPNPLLAAEPVRDVETPSGKRLTMLSPDQITREVHELGTQAHDIRIVSLEPLSEEGVPDDWESKALKSISNVPARYTEVVEVDGQESLRLLSPLLVEPECLSCHVERNHEVGDVRGGISTSFPLAPYWLEERPLMISTLAAHLVLWFVGVFGVLMASQTLKRRAGEKDQAVRQREESEAFLQSVIDCTPDPLMVLERDGRLALANAAARAKSRQGASAAYCFEILHSRTSMCAGDEHPCPMNRVFLEKVPARVEHIHYDEDGLEYPVEVVAAPIFDAAGNVKQVVESCRDIRERKQNEEARHVMQERMLEAQKLESLGVLAGGIAHDFNNILVAILGNAEIALIDVTETASTRGNLRDIKSAAKRAADLCSQLLAYSGKGKFVVDLVDLSALIEEMKGFLEMSVGKKIPLRFELFEGLASVEADPTQMRQIIMNLVINAAEAQESKRSPVTVQTSMVHYDADALEGWQINEVSGQKEFVLLEVQDEGVGMNPETLKRVFEPFFTTKFTGRGLGMAAVLGIVRGHGGAIQIDSEQGKGTTIRVLLPACEAPERKAAKPQSRLEPVVKRAGTVLLVDDEADVLRMVTTLLKRLGFDVVTATDGNEAIEVFRAHRGDIVTIVLDLTMPNTDGVQCLESLRKIDTTVPVIISSGYSAQEIYSQFKESDVADFIQKPFGMERLSEALAQALGKRPV